MAVTAYTLPLASTWKLTQNTVGVADLSAVYTAGNLGAPWTSPSGALPAITMQQQIGQLVTGQSNDSVYGGMATFIFLAVPTSTTVTQGLAYTWKGGDYTVVVQASSVAAAAQSGLPVAIALNSVTSNATSLQYTWFLVQGRGAALKSATITAQPNVPLFISGATAGRVRTTASIFRCYIGMRSANAATATGSILPVYLHFCNLGPGV